MRGGPWCHSRSTLADHGQAMHHGLLSGAVSSERVPAVGCVRVDISNMSRHIAEAVTVRAGHSGIASASSSSRTSEGTERSDTTSTSTPRSSSSSTWRPPRLNKPQSVLGDTRKSMPLSLVSSPRATDPKTRIRSTRRFVANSLIFSRFASIRGRMGGFGLVFAPEMYYRSAARRSAATDGRRAWAWRNRSRSPSRSSGMVTVTRRTI